MTNRDWENAFGSVPAHFQDTVSRELTKIKEERPVKKMKRLTVVAIALLIVLIAAIAYAAVTQWNIQSFMSRWYGAEVTEEGQQTLQTLSGYTAETEEVTVTIRQALCDGENVSVLIAVTPKHPDKVLLLGFDTFPEDALCNLGLPEYDSDFTPINESTLAQGKVLMAVECTLFYGDEMPDQNGHYAMEADGTQVFLQRFSLPTVPDAEAIELRCLSTHWVREGNPEAYAFRTCDIVFPVRVERSGDGAAAIQWPECR